MSSSSRNSLKPTLVSPNWSPPGSKPTSASLLQRLTMELTQAEQRDRQQLAKTLHDHLQQLLVGAKFNLNILRGQIQDTNQRGSLDQVNELLDESVTASRSLTQDLSPPVLKDGSLTQILHALARWAKDKHNLEVRVNGDEQADSQCQEVRVLLFQAVRELLLNVIHHAKVDGATVTLTRAGTDIIHLTVADDGVGFDPAALNDNNKPPAGFGLFGIRQRLELLGGSMEIDAKPGRGARVTLQTPVSPAFATPPSTAAPQQATAVPPAAQPPAAADTTKVIRVLLADDHAVVRNGLARLLQIQPDIEVVGQAADGLQVVQMALRLEPDIILMDVSMPYLSGVDVTRRLTQQMPGISVIGLSMHAQEDVAASMTAAGAAAYLTKTAPPETLIAAIRRCAARHDPSGDPGPSQ